MSDPTQGAEMPPPVALALAADASTLEHARAFADAAMLRAAASQLGAQALAADMIRAADEVDPAKREEPTVRCGRLPGSRLAFDSTNPALPGAGAHTDPQEVRLCES